MIDRLLDRIAVLPLWAIGIILLALFLLASVLAGGGSNPLPLQ